MAIQLIDVCPIVIIHTVAAVHVSTTGVLLLIRQQRVDIVVSTVYAKLWHYKFHIQPMLCRSINI
eukprot:12169172-Ditylum_brightwellii.AAC.1